MKRILTKLLSVLVPCLLVIGSIGFACMADEAVTELAEPTTAETEVEQPEDENDEDQDQDAQNEDPDSGLPPSEPDSDDTGAADETAATDETFPQEPTVPEDPSETEGDTDIKGSDETEPTEAEEQKEEYKDVQAFVPGKVFAFAKYDPNYSPAKALVPAGSGLYRYHMTGNDAKVYQLFRNYFRDVANGNRTSTTFEVTFEELGVTGKYYTAADLGVTDLVVDGEITSEAMTKMQAIVDCNIQSIVDKLLFDCPFDCYWYNKTAQVTGTGYGVGGRYANGEWQLYFQGTGYTYNFPIAQAYSGGTYAVNPAQINRALAASAKAKQIVAKYKDCSDYDKLLKYKEEICVLVDYNHGAADNNNTPFGDPWQLVYVFDGDTSTDVVCEGYSKAFKYLCDLSTFDGDVTCILATGVFSTTNGTNGGHMWNIVSFGGTNYMVDVTNCDDGAIGQKDKLFIKPYTSKMNSSTYKYKISSVTCTYNYYDNTVGFYSDSALALTDAAYIPAPVISINPTCLGIELNWDAIDGAQRYDIFRRVENGDWDYLGSSTQTEITDVRVEEGVTYYYGIRGVNSQNQFMNNYDEQNYVKYIPQHEVIIDPGIEPTHEHSGVTEGAHCGLCGKTLIEQQPIPALKTPVTIITQPESFEGAIGKTATFKVVAEGEDLMYQWQLKKGSSWANLSSGGANTDTMSIKIDATKDGKVYRCLITSSNGLTAITDEVTLHVKQPTNAITISKQPADFVGTAGSTARFTVSAEGTGLNYQWQLKKGKSWANLTAGGATTSSMTIKVDDSKNGKVYRCLITDVNGEELATNEVSITVKQPSNAIIIGTQPSDYSGAIGTIARFKVVAEGEGLTYQWQLKKGSSWADLTSGGATTSTMSIKIDAGKNGKVYRCVITDANGEMIVTKEVTITVKEPSNAITIVSQPVSYEGPTGQTARFTVTAEGEGLTYQWQLKKGSSWADLTSGGATTSAFLIKADASRNGKVYRCVIRDVNGEEIITDEVRINIQDELPPVTA